MFMKKNKDQCGFTIIELVVVAVISGILFGASLSMIDYQQKSGLQASLEEMTAVVRDIQKRSITQESGALWGIRLSRPPSGPSKYEIFRGTVYDADKIVKSLSLGRGAEFSGILSGGFLDLFFYQNGAASKNATIVISSPGVKFTGVIIVRVSGKIVSGLEKGLVGYWLFDEGAGSLVLDASGGGHLGNVAGTPPPLRDTSANCKSGNCLKFQESASAMVSGDLQKNFSKFSIAGWVKIENSGTYGGIFSAIGAGNSFSGEITFPRKPAIWSEPPAGGESFDLNQSLASNVWYYLTFIYDGATRKIFVDGTEKGSNSLAGADFSPATFLMGKRVSVPEFFSGWLDEIRVYDRALDAKEVFAQYNIMR